MSPKAGNAFVQTALVTALPDYASTLKYFNTKSERTYYFSLSIEGCSGSKFLLNWTQKAPEVGCSEMLGAASVRSLILPPQASSSSLLGFSYLIIWREGWVWRKSLRPSRGTRVRMRPSKTPCSTYRSSQNWTKNPAVLLITLHAHLSTIFASSDMARNTTCWSNLRGAYRSHWWRCLFLRFQMCRKRRASRSAAGFHCSLSAIMERKIQRRASKVERCVERECFQKGPSGTKSYYMFMVGPFRDGKGWAVLRLSKSRCEIDGFR